MSEFSDTRGSDKESLIDCSTLDSLAAISSKLLVFGASELSLFGVGYSRTLVSCE